MYVHLQTISTMYPSPKPVQLSGILKKRLKVLPILIIVKPNLLVHLLGPGTISSTTSQSFSYSINIDGSGNLIDVIKLTCNASVGTTITTSKSYTLEEKEGKTVRMWYEPSIVKVTGTARFNGCPPSCHPGARKCNCISSATSIFVWTLLFGH